MKVLLFALVFLGSLPTLQAKVKVKYICLNDGRYWVQSGNGPKRYCYDRKYYTEQTMPPEVRAYFEEQSRRTAATRAELEESRKVSLKQMEAMGVQPRTGGPGPDAKSLHQQRFGSRQPLTGRNARYSTVEASAKPEPEALCRDLVRAIEPGAERDAVIAKLGEPHGRVAGDSSGAESWTYVVEGGAFAKIKIERGMVVKVTVP
jgi:hypothetical protein